MSYRSLVRVYRMVRSDSTAETIAAVVLLAIVVGPTVVRYLGGKRTEREVTGN